MGARHSVPRGRAIQERLGPACSRARCALRLRSTLETCPHASYVHTRIHDRFSSCERTLAMTLDEKTQTELEAAAFRRLIEHLRSRTDVQNIDLMNLAGFCRNCLSNWMKDAAAAHGVSLSREESRELIYGMPYEQWKAKYQKESSNEQQAGFDKAAHKH